jgi:hypothetical protein
MLGVLLNSGLVWAGGTEITAIKEPISNWVVTMQFIIGIIGTFIIMIAALLAWRSEAAGLIGLFFGILCIIIAFKAPDIIATFGPQRAIAAPLTPVVITAGQQVLDGLVTWLVNTSLFLIGVWQVRHARRTARI